MKLVESILECHKPAAVRICFYFLQLPVQLLNGGLQSKLDTCTACYSTNEIPFFYCKNALPKAGTEGQNGAGISSAVFVRQFCRQAVGRERRIFVALQNGFFDRAFWRTTFISPGAVIFHQTENLFSIGIAF